jgi:hypothetical protein
MIKVKAGFIPAFFIPYWLVQPPLYLIKYWINKKGTSRIAHPQQQIEI